MKIIKIVLLSMLSIFAAFYMAFLIVLPRHINLNKYTPQITKIIQENTGLKVELYGLKIKTTWNLSLGASIDKTNLEYPTGEKFGQINNLQVKLSILPFIFKQIKINSLDADKFFINLDIAPNGDFLVKKYFKLKPAKNDKNSFILSNNLPKISTKKYRITFVDTNSNKKYTFKGNELKISDGILNKKMKIKTIGNLFFGEKNQISYNVSIHSNYFPNSQNKPSELIKTFEDIRKYNIKAKIKTNLKVEKKNDNINIDGKMDLDKISFIFANKLFPESNLKLDFKGNKAKINASLHADKNSKAIITGFFNTGKSKLIDIHVSSDRINIKDVLLILKAMSKPLGIKNLANISADGIIKADFNLKSNFKKIESSGYLKIKNASVNNKLYKVLVDSINADIDFSKNSIRIKQAKANLNGQPITINGAIDKNAVANISILANALQLKGLLLTSGQTKILNENNILGGLVDVNGKINGRLDKANWEIDTQITKIKLKNKKSQAIVNLPAATIKINKNGGTAQLSGLKINTYNNPTIAIPKLILDITKDNINIRKNYLYIDNIKTILSGSIISITKAPKLKNITISIPNQISVPIKNYNGSRIVLKGNINLNGDLQAPTLQGGFSVPLISIPSTSTVIKNSSLTIDREIKFNSPSIKIANSQIQISATAQKDLSKGLVIQNLNLSSDNLDMNYLLPLLNILPKADNGNSTLTILNGKSKINKFKAFNIVANNITSNISAKNNILYLNKISSDAYFGKVAGDINYNIAHNRMNVNLQGRNLLSNPTLVALVGLDDDIHGKLDFDSKVSLILCQNPELLKNLNGYTNFIISNGKMGILGKFEHLLYAQNIISNNIFKANLGLAVKAITVKNTGVYKYMKGKIAFSNGWANIKWIKTSGPTMSLYMTGRCYLPTNTADLTILGRISDDVVRILGPIGEFSVDKAISYIPKLGEITTFFANQFTTNPNYENISQIPDLTPKTEFKTKEFKVIIDGDIRKQSSVKSFKWLSRPRVAKSNQSQQNIKRASSQNYQQIKTYQTSPQTQPSQTKPSTSTSTSQNQQNNAALPDFLNKIPDYQIKN